MKKYLFTAVAMIVALITIYMQYNQNIHLKDKISRLVSNEKALIMINSDLETKSRAFKLSVEQLEYFNDSLIVEMNSLRKDLRIKDRNLKQMQCLVSETRKVDTIIFRDTIFKDPTIKIDTVLEDRWYKVGLTLEYPSTIISSPRFVNETHIIASYKKEPINPPKKFFLWRCFQRKHKIVEVEVIEKSPYAENKEQRFVEIVE